MHDGPPSKEHLSSPIGASFYSGGTGTILDMNTQNKTRRIVLIIVGLPILLFGLYTGYQFIQSSLAEGKVKHAREKAEQTSDQEFNGKVSKLHQTGLLGSKIASSRHDICYLNHNDAGWTITSWYQKCYLRYAEGYTTTATKEEIINALETTSGPVTNFDQPSLSCSIRDGLGFKEIARYRVAGSPQIDPFCGVPDPLQTTFSIRGAALHNDELSVKTYSTYDMKSIDSSSNQIWLTSDYEYYDEQLGCFIPLVCNSPRSKPIQAP